MSYVELIDAVSRKTGDDSQDVRRHGFSIEGPDYYPWQEGLYVESPYKIKDGHIELPVSPGWGVEIHPDWLQRASYQMTEVS
jgi:hypothetical protein